MEPARPVVAALLAAALASAVIVGPAQAALPSRATVNDRVGDAPAAIDLRSVTYSVNRERTVFRASLRDLNARSFVAFESWPLTSAWDRIAIRRVDGRTVARVYFVDNDLQDSDVPVATRTRCPGLEVSWRPYADVVSAVVPARCLRASRPDTRPFELHTFTRLGDRRDTAPKVTLDYPS
jgi:hypothetical protein